MTTFTYSCIAKDHSGKPTAFRAGQRVVIRSDNCPQIDGVEDTVRACFYQDTSTHSEEHGLAVLLANHSWAYCRDLEPQGEE